MNRLQGVILDVDGTLVDSNDAHAHAWTDALHEHGHDVSFEHVRRLIGMGGDNLLPEVAQIESKSDAGERINKRRGELLKQRHLGTVTGLPQARALLQRMLADGLQLVVASSAVADELDPLLSIANASDLVPERTSADDAKNSKPEPDIVQAALKKIGLRPDAVLMLGDTPYDIASARKANVGTVALRSGGWSDADLEGAVAIYDDPADLLRNYDQSPFGQAGTVSLREG